MILNTNIKSYYLKYEMSNLLIGHQRLGLNLFLSFFWPRTHIMTKAKDLSFLKLVNFL